MLDISEKALANALEKVPTLPLLPCSPLSSVSLLNTDQAKSTLSSSLNTKLETRQCDVTSESSVAAAVSHLDAWGGVDIMFNNAGIMHADDADAVSTDEKIWDLTHAINVKGVWFGSKHAVLSMRKHGKVGPGGKGSIINTASVVALVGSATPQLAYTASKGAVLAMTRELAIVHARDGIRFNALCPAPLK